ncbi:polysaccharide biosynthesis C-terminal domain-containing protein [Hymenobacter tibetensis]|uniref:Polysaccharide biosynthesis C-terminal domain-containing protein n=1 Tax=Hymenobacter tibetensis TaxID=497967 RepID=A0ABY4CWI1_9BACT|nr:polysaccharide biosynthesis C-terminal domain-containing protein [Hymenobacter tibetensis]UOG74446.1 polysaccharide biosynthesis C-terminal domain-containing protein [Hymenobacter tibetensis]
MSVAKKLASQAAIYGVSSIVGRVLTYFLVPVYTARFAPAEYGVVTDLYAYVAFFNVLYTYGLETAYFRFANRPGTDRDKLYSQVLSLLLLSSTALSGALILLATPITEALRYPGQERYIVWLALILGIDSVVSIPFARLRLENKARKFAGVRLTNIVVNVLLTLFFVVFCPDVLAGKYLPQLHPLVEAFYIPQLGVGYVFLVNLLANVLYIPLLWRELSDFRFRLDWLAVPSLWRYGYPIMIMGLAGMVNEMLSRLMLKYWLPEGFYPGQSNLAALGVFGACYKLSIFMQLVIQAFRYAAEPFFFSQSNERNSPATFALVLKWFTLCCALIFVGVSLNLDWLGKLFLQRAEYREGLIIVPILLLANLFLGMYYNLSVWFKLTDKTYYGTTISLGGAVLTIGLNFLLIPVLGYLGSALATLVCYFTMAVICWRLGERHFPVPYPMARLAGWLLVATAVVAVGWFVPIEQAWLQYTWHAVLCVGFIGLLAVVEKPHRLAR